MKSRFFFVLCAALFLAGCAAPMPEVQDLERVKQVRSFELKEVKEWQTGSSGKGGVFRKSQEISLLPGQYVAIKSNGLGIFFLGSGYSVVERLDTSGVFGAGVPYVEHQGGIWIPSDATKGPRLFAIPGQFRGSRGVAPAIKDREAAHSSSGNQANDKSVTSTVTQLAINNTPSGSSPGFAGAAAGVTTGLILALIDPDKLDPMILNWEITESEFTGQIRAAISTQN